MDLTWMVFSMSVSPFCIKLLLGGLALLQFQDQEGRNRSCTCLSAPILSRESAHTFTYNCAPYRRGSYLTNSGLYLASQTAQKSLSCFLGELQKWISMRVNPLSGLSERSSTCASLSLTTLLSILEMLHLMNLDL